MKVFNLKSNAHIHFIGIGGIGMSSLAQILYNYGYKVSGSDQKTSLMTEKLTGLGIQVNIGHSASNVKNADMVVYTAAVKSQNPEIIRALELNIPGVDRAEMLGEVMKNYQYSIGVSGTHGKTTTTSMISLIFMKAGLDPTVCVGGENVFLNGNARVGNSQYFVAEACEYVESFLNLNPFIGVILNIDADHLDYYKDINHIYKSFEKYSRLINKNGYLIANFDDKRVKELAQNADCSVISFSIAEKSMYQAVNIDFDQEGHVRFELLHMGQNLGAVSLNVFGEHNVYDALASIAAAMECGVEFDVCRAALNEYIGAKRRFEYKGMINGARIFDDFAHHPTEIAATLIGAKRCSHNKIWCVFQPAAYSRLKALLREFSNSFAYADKIIIMDIIPLGEIDTGEIHSKDLVRELIKNGKDAVYLNDTDEVCNLIIREIKEKDILITMSGFTYKIAECLTVQKTYAD